LSDHEELVCGELFLCTWFIGYDLDFSSDISITGKMLVNIYDKLVKIINSLE